MASSASGLTRRRGVGGSSSNLEGEDGSRVGSPVPKRSDDSRVPETSYENSENGHKIAFDPRDISESAERNKQPKLTLMEEVLLMGLKDKQVGWRDTLQRGQWLMFRVTGLPVILERQHIVRAAGLHSRRTRF